MTSETFDYMVNRYKIELVTFFGPGAEIDLGESAHDNPSMDWTISTGEATVQLWRAPEDARILVGWSERAGLELVDHFADLRWGAANPWEDIKAAHRMYTLWEALR